MALTAFQQRAAVVVANVATVAATILAFAPVASADDDDDYWGAIAYSPSGDLFGRAKHYPSKAAAESAAQAACAHKDCKTLVIFKQCGAVAENSARDMAGGYGATLAAAQADALKTLGTSGSIATWFCN
ncbi:hypothetical protein BST27_29640 [Mycobacterium intermedium]|uniref:DUF4189 domain-containing protein n=1 Tax=Mycobacterium intermedium TaxID=28445 RepID=A0A1E3S7J8_MYCIE|nr:DUF4189 domain-containing protein [Mycobacterium intermedium]MCV6965327.1 DUF4189 domain-containing protein [Mycobacterium intermedium]ODQ98119.1 hypothetical protein BHQ20_23490 [Mycobacterium intermedium]OPE47055.1 hypothetical protein BV508_23495 [Mycobacterium intermedium]ORA90605.1 hypothetical protein BST27_29640 [Mycobacterium intermedium]